MGNFLINSKNKEEVPIISFDYKVKLIGNLCELEIIQEYENKSDKNIQVAFVFPFDVDLSFSKLVATFGDETLESKIDLREVVEEKKRLALKKGKKIVYGAFQSPQQ